MRAAFQFAPVNVSAVGLAEMPLQAPPTVTVPPAGRVSSRTLYVALPPSGTASVDSLSVTPRGSSSARFTVEVADGVPS